MAEPTAATRRPYTGSCHCGAIRYIVYLSMPHDPPAPDQLRSEDGRLRRQLFYRCNCTTCHKAGLMHLRLPSPPDDFLLLAPLDPLRELAEYRCYERRLRFLFCKQCGMRCFTFAGEGELVEKDVGGETKTVWAPRRGWVENMENYLSVNAYTIDAGQEGIDMREWTEKKWVMYLDCLSDMTAEQPVSRTYDRPFPGGAY